MNESAASERDYAVYRIVGAATDWSIALAGLEADRAFGTKRRNDKALVYDKAEKRLLDAVHAYRKAR